MVSNGADRNTALIKGWAKQLGFDSVGIAEARYLEEEAPKLEQWLNSGFNAGMQYMENHYDMRLDPRKLVPGARSVITFSYNYFPEEPQPDDVPKLAKYAYGEDYHRVIRKKLKKMLALIRENIGDVNGRAFVDSAPVLERVWGKLSGLGWIGKHTLLISKKKGSFFFLAELIIDLELEYDSPVTDHCGDCRLCIDACPTDAILGNGLLDAGKCISYLTIELKGDTIPAVFAGQMSGWYFGCDICQDVCPWNRFSKQNNEPAFQPAGNILTISDKEWLEITEEVFNQKFSHSPLKRSGWKGIQRNIRFLNPQTTGISTFANGESQS